MNAIIVEHTYSLEHQSKYSRISEVFASEFIEGLEDMFRDTKSIVMFKHVKPHNNVLCFLQTL